MKTQAKSLLVQLFPEFSQAFSDVFGAAASAVLRQLPSARMIAQCPVDVLTDLLRTVSHGRLGKVKAELLIDLAEHSVGIQSMALELQMQMFLQQIDLFTLQINRYEVEIKSEMERFNLQLQPFPELAVSSEL